MNRYERDRERNRRAWIAICVCLGIILLTVVLTGAAAHYGIRVRI